MASWASEALLISTGRSAQVASDPDVSIVLHEFTALSLAYLFFSYKYIQIQGEFFIRPSDELLFISKVASCIQEIPPLVAARSGYVGSSGDAVDPIRLI